MINLETCNVHLYVKDYKKFYYEVGFNLFSSSVSQIYWASENFSYGTGTNVL